MKGTLREARTLLADVRDILEDIIDERKKGEVITLTLLEREAPELREKIVAWLAAAP